MKTYHTFSSEETQALGSALAKSFAKQKPRRSVVIALQGDLGAGKTTFVQGFLKGLGSKSRAQSPTFIIMRRHALRGRFKNVFHVDAYRLKNAGQLKVLNFHEILTNPEHVILIEWPARVKALLPKQAQWILFKHGKKENERTIVI